MSIKKGLNFYIDIRKIYVKIVLQSDNMTCGGNDMAQARIEDQVRQFCDAWQDLNMIYEDYARSVNVPYTSLYILSLITTTKDCTQKIICEKTFLPRQTVNTIITGFYKKKWITLEELPEDRRIKTIHLTKAGQEFADGIIPQIRKAEREAMENLTLEQQSTLLEGIRIYRDSFRSAMLPGGKE